MGISKTGCSASITKTDLDRAYKQGFADCAKILDECKKELQAFKDKQEQGLLIETKCRVGGYVYYPVEVFNVVIPVRINEIVISDLGNGKSCFQYNGITFDESGDVYEEYEFDDNDFGKIVFATEAEAEEALARMKGE